MQKLANVFSQYRTNIDHAHILEHPLHTKQPPIIQAPRLWNPIQRAEEDRHMQEMQDNGITTPSSSPWSSYRRRMVSPISMSINTAFMTSPLRTPPYFPAWTIPWTHSSEHSSSQPSNYSQGISRFQYTFKVKTGTPLSGVPRPNLVPGRHRSLSQQTAGIHEHGPTYQCQPGFCIHRADIV